LIVLDTHAWVWWLADDARLSGNAREALASAEEVGVPAACCWELASLVSGRKVALAVPPLTFMKRALALSRVRLLPLTPEIAIRGAGLNRAFPRDPADRQIVATALELNAPLVTRDDLISRSRLVRTVW
jgi:PIN domain nuclease of toxin-antitoxin system